MLKTSKKKFEYSHETACDLLTIPTWKTRKKYTIYILMGDADIKFQFIENKSIASNKQIDYQ